MASMRSTRSGLARSLNSGSPFLGIFRRFIPLIGPLDLSPLVGLIVLNIVRVIVVNAIHG